MVHPPQHWLLRLSMLADELSRHFTHSQEEAEVVEGILQDLEQLTMKLEKFSELYTQLNEVEREKMDFKTPRDLE